MPIKLLATWLNRKKKNRSRARRRVLEVKVSSIVARQARLRLGTIAVSVTLATLFGLYVFWRAGEWALDTLVYENNAFAIHELDIQTDGVISLEQLRSWAGVKLEDNLFALDLARVKRDLELVPCIQSASVERVLPHLLKIRVIEREPLAQINLPNLTMSSSTEPFVYLLDLTGHVMLPIDPRQRRVPATSDYYPAITGLNTQDLRPGQPVDSPQLKAALRLIAAFDKSPMAAYADLMRIDVSAPDTLHVTTSLQNQVVLSTANLERQLHRWWLVYDRGQQEGRQISTLDLSVTDNAPLRWIELGTTPPVTPKVRKPSPYKKKHA